MQGNEKRGSRRRERKLGEGNSGKREEMRGWDVRKSRGGEGVEEEN